MPPAPEAGKGRPWTHVNGRQVTSVVKPAPSTFAPIGACPRFASGISRTHRKETFVDACNATHYTICNALHYTLRVISSFRHKGLKRYFCGDDRSGIDARHASRLTFRFDSGDAVDIDLEDYH